MTGPSHPRSRGATAILAAVLVPALSTFAACERPPIAVEGQLGDPIALASEAGGRFPRVAFRREACPGTAGGCTSFCTGDPASCPEDACLSMLVDTGAPLTVVAGDQFRIDRTCFEIRGAGGLEIDPPSEGALARAVARLRFVDPPLVEVPATPPGGWGWTLGDDLQETRVGGVLGGNVLRDFAVVFRHLKSRAIASVTLERVFPGDEPSLANAGRAYLPVQYPGRIVGRLPDDRCEIGGVDCFLSPPISDAVEADLVHRSTRLVMDACVAPPPCDTQIVGDACRITPGGAQAQNDCIPANDPDRGGANAALVVATGLPGLVLFSDSAQRMFGAISALPDCAALTSEDIDARACIETDAGRLSVPGWEPEEGLTVLRVRALSLVSGTQQVSTVPPCTRHDRRVRALSVQCEGFRASTRPWRPRPTSTSTPLGGALTVGELAWLSGQSAPDTTRWIRTILVPPDAPMAAAVRRDVSSTAIEPDGMVGSAILDDIELVVDYTETNGAPGLRATCLSPGDGRCRSVPTCRGINDGLGDRACCFGIARDVLVDVLGRPTEGGARPDDTCCAALSAVDVESLQAIPRCSGYDGL